MSQQSVSGGVMSGASEYETPSGQPNSSLLFPPSWQGLRQQIVYLAQFGSSIQVIHADAGGGKSTFFSHLLRSGLGSTTIGVSVVDGAGLAAFFYDVLAELGLRPSASAGLGELAAGLRSFVQTLHKERARAVLLVDDAHFLTDSELGALVSTLQGQADPGVGLHVVLFATPGLAARIDALQVLDVEVHDAALPVFAPAEISQLLQARPQGAGISAEQIRRIWQQSEGRPGDALIALEHLRPPQVAASQALSLRGLPVGHIAALVVLCAVLVWAFLVRGVEHSHQKDAVEIPIPASPAPYVAVPSAEKPPTISPENPLISTDKQPPTAEVIHASVAESEGGINLDYINGRSAPEGGVEPELTREPEKPSNGDRPVVPESVKVSQTPSGRGAARLLSYPPNAYVLQVMAASAEDKLEAYIAEQPNKLNLYMYRTERDGKVLYILVEGFYADKASAQAAIVNLPARQRDSGAWAKRIEQIQQEIRKTAELR
jgi:DamX protein